MANPYSTAVSYTPTTVGNEATGHTHTFSHPHYISHAITSGESESYIHGRGPYATKGEEIVCENGHVICTVARDIKRGELFDPEVFHRWRDPPPTIGTEKQPCCRCGAEWFRGTSFHFKEGWR